MSRIEKNADWLNTVATASCLCLNAEEQTSLASDIEAELSYLARETFTGIPERWWERAVGIESLREDHVGVCLDREDLLNPSAHHNDTCFLVPRVLGDEGGET